MSAHADRGEILRWLRAHAGAALTPVPGARRARADGRAEGHLCASGWAGTPTPPATARRFRCEPPLPARASGRRVRRADLRRRLRRAVACREKLLAWHLYLAALAGRDIYYDQRYAHNLELRAALEGILTHARGLPAHVVDEVRRYTKLFWINSGPHNGVTARKQLLRLTTEEWVRAVDGGRRRRCAAP